MNIILIGLGITVLVAFVFVLCVVSMYNGIVEGKNRVKRAWADVIAYQVQKIKVIPELERGLKQYQEFEQGTQEKLAELRSSLGRLSGEVIDPKALEKVQSQSQMLLSGLRATFEAYPNLKTSDLYRRWMKELSEIQSNITAAITIFNQCVQSFNNSLQVFPSNLVNARLNHETPVTVFSDSKAQAEFEYQPNI